MFGAPLRSHDGVAMHDHKLPGDEGVNFLISLVVGILVGGLYASLRVASPAPPLVALIGLLGIVIGERGVPFLLRYFQT